MTDVAGKERSKTVLREVERLMRLAMSTDDEVLRRSAVRHAVALCRRTRTKMPKRYSRLICRRCLSLYKFSGGSRFRVKRGRTRGVVITCGNCRSINRIPID